MSLDSLKVLDELLKGDRLTSEEKNAIRDSIYDIRIAGEWTKIGTVYDLKKFLAVMSDYVKFENFELRTLRNIKTGEIIIEHRNPDSLED